MTSTTETFIKKVLDDTSSEAELREAAHELIEAAAVVSVQEKENCLRALAQHLNVSNPVRARIVALVCGALVEKGCDPVIIADPVIERLTSLLQSAAALAKACEARMPSGKELDPDKAFEANRAEVEKTMAAENVAWETLESFWPVTIAMFSTSADRARARALRDVAASIAIHHTAGHWLRFMLSVLDREPILVLEPDTRPGIVGRISGVVDNFQLNVLLMDAFPRRGCFSRRRIPQTVVDIAKGLGPQTSEEHVSGVWNLYTWKALTKDGNLPPVKGFGADNNWIWNEGVPDDIPVFDGRRVILLGPASYARGWRAQRLFNKLPARLDVERKLKKAEVEEWIARFVMDAAGN